MNKKGLAVLLSDLETFEGNVKLEQYMTDPEIAADLVWHAFLCNDIKDMTVLDLGCGNGVLGIGALILGAKKVYFVDVDKTVLGIAKKNARNFKNTSFVCCDVREFDGSVDVVIENPPFGVQREHTDKVFLEKAMSVANKVYSFHKIESVAFIESLAREHGFRVNGILKYDFLLKKSMDFHRKKYHKVRVGCWILEKKTKALK